MLRCCWTLTASSCPSGTLWPLISPHHLGASRCPPEPRGRQPDAFPGSPCSLRGPQEHTPPEPRALPCQAGLPALGVLQLWQPEPRPAGALRAGPAPRAGRWLPGGGREYRGARGQPRRGPPSHGRKGSFEGGVKATASGSHSEPHRPSLHAGRREQMVLQAGGRFCHVYVLDVFLSSVVFRN